MILVTGGTGLVGSIINLRAGQRTAAAPEEAAT
jgi:hypothetical protein